MTNSLAVARQTLLAPAELDEHSLQRVLSGLMRPGVDAADLYFQHSLTESWSLEDGIVKSGSHHVEQGVGVRACSGEKQGLAYSDEIRFQALTDAAGAACAIVRQGSQTPVQAWKASGATAALYPALNPLGSFSTEQKLDLLRRADTAARAADA
ncbi:MAG: PmbA/TldA family metallopeptidase, partial [Stenotrophobium sp.]